MNGDPFVGMLETPVTSNPEVVNFLSNLPAYRTGVSPLLRGVEVGLAHGFLLPGPFIKVSRGRAAAQALSVGQVLSRMVQRRLVAAILMLPAAGGAMTQQPSPAARGKARGAQRHS